MTNIFDHEILRRIQINQPKSYRKQVKNRPPPRDTPPAIHCRVKNSTLGRYHPKPSWGGLPPMKSQMMHFIKGMMPFLYGICVFQVVFLAC